jgi:pyruvate/2-oxoacid:ferredoxin oxidoreductase alpha subunit
MQANLPNINPYARMHTHNIAIAQTPVHIHTHTHTHTHTRRSIDELKMSFERDVSDLDLRLLEKLERATRNVADRERVRVRGRIGARPIAAHPHTPISL